MTPAIRLGVSISHAAAALAQRGALDADYIVWYGQIGGERVAELAAHKPLLLHDLSDSFWLNYADPFDEALMTRTRAILDAMGCPWLSTGIGASAEPQAHRHGPYREANPEDVQPRQRVIDNIVRHGQRLQAWAGIPLLLENFNFHPTGAYDYICEPALFSELIAAIGCGMLLDLGHARISAQNMRAWGGDVAVYLSALPLEKVREIHFNRPGWQRGERVDLHQPVCADDLAWLAWVLDRTPHVEAVTLEIEEMDEAALTAQIALLRGWLKARHAGAAQRRDQPWCIAHRGASAYAQENSPEALAGAARLGADFVEVDVRVTADEVPVIAHDDSLERVYGVEGLISRLTLAEVQARAPVMTFGTLLESCARLDLGVYLDIKTLTPSAAAHIFARIDAAAHPRPIIFASFSHDLIAAIKAQRPDALTAILFGSTHIDPVALAQAVSADYVHPCWENASDTPHDLLTDEWLARVRAAGLGIITWHEERPLVIAGLKARQVTGICTDRPELVSGQTPAADAM